MSVSVANSALLSTISVGGAAANLNVPSGQTSALTFQAHAGDQVSLSAAFPTNSVESPSISLLAPDGSVDDTASMIAGSNPGSIIGEYLDSITLPETGTYVIVGASSEDDVDLNTDDQFTLQLYSAPLIAESITLGGPSVTLNPSVPGQTAQLTFTGSANQTVSFGYVTEGEPPIFSGINPDGSTFNVSFSYPLTFFPEYTSYSFPIVLPQDGIYQINIDFLGQTQPLVVNLYDATAGSGTISIGGPPVAVSTGPGQYVNLSFEGTKDQQISLGASTSDSGTASVSILKPDGTLLNNTSVEGAAYTDDFTLPCAGTYTAQISGVTNAPETLSLQLYDATPVDGSISIDGAPVSMNTSPGQPLELSLTTTASSQQTSLVISGSSYWEASVSVLNPDGTSLGSGFLNNEPGSVVSGVVSLPILPVAQTYTIEVVGEGPGSATLQLLSTPQENLTTLIGGPPVDVALQVPGQDANITFSANAGQWVSLSTSNSTLDECAGIELVNPDSSQADGLAACDPSDVMSATQLTQTGTYSIFVDGNGATGDIDVQLNDATPVSGAISINGPTVVASMSAPSQNFEYTFTGEAGQEIGLSMTNFSSYNLSQCYPAVILDDPDGNYVDALDLSSSQFPDGTASLKNGADVLASNDTYSILVANDGCSIGGGDIELYTSNTQVGAITLNGAAVTATSNVPGQLTQLTFRGCPGQTISLNTSNSTYEDCVEITLTDPNNVFLDGLYQCGAADTMGPETLMSNGTYTLLVTPVGEAGSIDLNLVGE